MNYFCICIIFLFCGAGAMEYFTGNPGKAIFYLLSAAINLNVMFLK